MAVQTFTPQELQRRLQQSPPPLLLDVREAWEVELAALPGALHVPMHEIPDRRHELDAGAEIVVLCHHGVRSAHVAAFLAQAGFARLYNLAGGIDAWAREIDPHLPRY